MISRIRSISKIPYMKDIVDIIAAFLVAWLFYQGLGFATGTSMPIVSVVSESMEPILHKGDLLVVAGTQDPRVGDIVIYQNRCLAFPSQDKTIVHRIINETPEGFVIKGDNNVSPDPCIVRKEQIIGKVWVAVPLLGYPRLALYAVGI